jgi:hypothetical protein
VLDNPPEIPFRVVHREQGADIDERYHTNLLEEEINTPIEGGSLARARVVYRGDNKMDITFAMDHAATDGFGCGSFFKEWVFEAAGQKMKSWDLSAYGYPLVDERLALQG